MRESGLVLLLRLDQRQRWQQGERIPVEAYLEQQPALRDDPEGILDLIYQEVVLREDQGEQPQLEDYLRRFPALDVPLRIQFDVHRAIEGEAVSGDLATPSSGVTTLKPSPFPRTALEGTVVAGYEILGELGRGGMGVVYRARQLSLKRLVALKMILAGPYAGARERSRFRKEAEAAARLQHPNIVQIHEVGEQDACLFLSLELVNGVSLEKKFGETPQPARPAAQLVETLARAMHYAHQRGIIHRDLKPGNVLLTDDGVAKITDFGLAKVLDADTGLTPPEAFLGTPNYMAPEQAAGAAHQVGPGADVYALGAILYYLLTGCPPFHGNTLVDTLEQVRSREPVSPVRWQANLPHELETICLKCLEKEPGRRYASALDLAEDLRRFLAGEPIHARPVARWERLRKWVRRRPTAAALIGVSSAAVLSLAALVFWHHRELQATAALARAGGHQEVEQAQRNYQKFIQDRDDALFYGTCGTIFTDVDEDANLKSARTAAREALALAGAAIEGDAPPTLEPLWSAAQRAEVLAGCYQLLLLLAEAEVSPLPHQTAAEQHRQARQALNLLDRAARLVPPTQAYHLRRARYLSRLGDGDGAKRERETAACLEPARMIDHFLLGEERYRQGHVEQACRDFQNALLLQPNDFWSRYFLAVCYLKLRLPSEARACLTECIGQRPHFVWTYLLRSFAHEKLNAFEAAEADYRVALQLHPSADARYFLHVNRGRLRLEQRKFDEAVADLRQAITLQRAPYDAHVNLARVYNRQQKYAEAVQQLDQAIRLGPPAPLLADYHAERGYNLYLHKKYEEAVRSCDLALALRPDYALAHGLRARALLQLQRYEQATQAYDRYLDKGGQPVEDVYRGRGLARMKLHNYLGAVDDYTRALQLRPTADVYTHRGWAYFFADAWRPALQDFQAAIGLEAEQGEARIGRGLARVMIGQYRAAVTDAEEALRRPPATPEMMHNVACIFALAVGKAEHDSGEEDRQALAAAYRARAIGTLGATLRLLPPAERPGFWRAKIVGDPALDPIRGCTQFQHLVQQYGNNFEPGQ